MIILDPKAAGATPDEFDVPESVGDAPAVEVSQELDEYRNLTGERRILQYDN